LDDIPSVSDLSDLDSDSHDDESYHPKVADNSSCPADNESEEIDEGFLGEVGGVAEDIDDEILPDGDGAEPMVSPAVPAEDASANGHLGPLVKRRRLARERSQRVWSQDDLPVQFMPDSIVKPRGLEDCDSC
jgi:hypothetical protein